MKLWFGERLDPAGGDAIDTICASAKGRTQSAIDRDAKLNFIVQVVRDVLRLRTNRRVARRSEKSREGLFEALVGFRTVLLLGDTSYIERSGHMFSVLASFTGASLILLSRPTVRHSLEHKHTYVMEQESKQKR